MTALVATSTNAPVRVRGSDGAEHLQYDLVITNVFAAPVTLSSVEVSDPDGAVLQLLEGEGLEAVAQPVFTGASTVEVPVSGAVAVVMDVPVPPGETPAQLEHRITYELPSDAPSQAVIGTLVADGPALVVDEREPVVLAPPLRGNGWLNGSGCCAASAQHRRVRLAADGSSYLKPETFAIDWVRLRDGRLFDGDGSQVAQWYGFGAELLAVADGTVVHVRDGMAEQTPGQPPVAVQETADFGGNQVIIEIEPGVFAAYAHLQPGSLRVQVGDEVEAGKVLGLLGNTGNSSGPHLHFGLQDSPDLLTSNSVPFVFERYTLDGTISENDLDAVAGPGATPAPLGGPSGDQADSYPLYLTVIGFP